MDFKKYSQYVDFNMISDFVWQYDLWSHLPEVKIITCKINTEGRFLLSRFGFMSDGFTTKHFPGYLDVDIRNNKFDTGEWILDEELLIKICKEMDVIWKNS